MGAIQNKVGIETKPFTFTVERGKVREFANAIGDDNPIYHDVAFAKKNGYGDLPVPPTFATVIDMWGGASFEDLIELLEVDPLKVLHGEQSYEYMKPIYAGDTITALMKVVDQKEKGSLTLFTLETLYRNERNENVLLARSVVIER
ncbi:MaoC family dehydratase N-terminal domain-containing protein [Guptibacillus algicola]|uniref:MaoC family dehydratase N-terminal domain-containing protein n=1 Tax=Guptibacillus algicola TaxID=225844 RepID=UPI001CD47685|nr:MaoC family dehydratase N-terminal domain-containing protein [Alkalihalobacillus algicola]MCA0988556.1 MaoC family dehydratase N-terminal domain-containing protein [Alkalihalobacillus algicola]